MVHEGEVKVSIITENLTRSSRWTLVAGHSSQGWVPPPFPLAQGAWAASTVATFGGRGISAGVSEGTEITKCYGQCH
jgi:hypothetical protein